MTLTRKTTFDRIAALLTAGMVSLGAASAWAEDVIASYTAMIAPKDQVSAKGAALGAPWQILQQDRDNYHRFGISQKGDEWDPFFSSIKHRKQMQRLVQAGSISGEAVRRLTQGGKVRVQVFGTGELGAYVKVTAAK